MAAEPKVSTPTLAERRSQAKDRPRASLATPVARSATERAALSLGERLAQEAERGAGALSRIAAAARAIEDRQAQAAAYRELRSSVAILADCAEVTANQIAALGSKKERDR
jgi:hypothetical protein